MSGGDMTPSPAPAPAPAQSPGAVKSVGLERRDVSAIQRTRLLNAMAEVATERGGGGNVTVALVVERAGVSRRTFYEAFEDCQACLLATIERAMERATERVLDAYRQEEDWRDRMGAALAALLALFEEDPDLCRLLVVESLAAGADVLQLRQTALRHVVEAVGEGHSRVPGSPQVSSVTAEAVAGGLLSVIHARVLEGGQARMTDLFRPLMSMLVLPYLGSAAACEELSRTLPEDLSRSSGVQANPLKSLELRLTYRTVRVLEVLGEHPGSSNRHVGEVSGIADQGQVSKLLARLGKLGLIENSGGGTARGGPNAWNLTERGEEVSCALAQHA